MGEIMPKKSGLVIVGLIYTFLINTLGSMFWLFNFPETVPNSDWQRPYWIMIGIFDFMVVILGILYLFNIFKSRIALGVLATITNLFGGILLLIGKDKEPIPNDSLEYKMYEINNLLKKKIISREEYEIQRTKLLNK
jgi:hypothetical protein